MIVYSRLIPESIRWLITNKKYLEAKKIIERIAVINNISLSQELKKQLDNLESKDDKVS